MNARTLLWSNAIISLAAGGCVLTSLQLSGMNWPVKGTAVFALGLSAATWCAYSWQRHIKSTRDGGLRPAHKTWQQRHARRLRALALLLLPMAAWPIWLTWSAVEGPWSEGHLGLWALVLAAGAVTALYAGWPGGSGRRLALRRLPGLKMVWIASVWGILTALWPLWWTALESHAALPETWGWLVLERALVIAALTLPFDLRDATWDSPEMRTWPQWLGPSGTRALGVGFLAGAVVMRTAGMGHGWIACAALWPMALAVGLAKPDRPAGYFVVLDACLIADAVWLWLCLPN